MRIRDFCHFGVPVEYDWLFSGTNEFSERVKLAILDRLVTCDMLVGHIAKDLETNENQHISVRKWPILGSKSGISGSIRT